MKKYLKINAILAGVTTVLVLLTNLITLWSYNQVAPYILGVIIFVTLYGTMMFSEVEGFDYDEEGFGIKVLILVALIIGIIVVVVSGTAATGGKKVAETTTILDGEVEGPVLPTEENISELFLMDSESALQLARRQLGKDTATLSQYNPSKCWTQIINGKPVKVVDMEYASLSRVFNNDIITKYAIVYNDNTCEVVEVEGGIKYAPSDICSQDLMRHVRKAYKGEMLGEYYFVIDDEGIPYWSVNTLKYGTFCNTAVVDGTILVNAVTGECTKYALADVPTWVDCVLTGDTVTTYYNRYGKYNNGTTNYMFSKVNVSVCTEDYGFIAIDNDVYVYTGITSMAKDESNIGFIMVNSRTGEMYRYLVGGPEEYSAMGSAEQEVANFGYNACFPSLIMYQGRPTYVMVLKDANGLVKRYAFVNYDTNYGCVAVAEKLADAQKKYESLLSGTAVSEVSEGTEVKTANVVIDEVVFVTVDGTTVVYIKSGTDAYKSVFTENLILLNEGDSVSINYYDTTSSIKTVESIN